MSQGCEKCGAMFGCWCLSELDLLKKEELARVKEDRDRLESEVVSLRSIARCNIDDCNEPIIHAFCDKHLYKERETAKRIIRERNEAVAKLIEQQAHIHALTDLINRGLALLEKGMIHE